MEQMTTAERIARLTDSKPPSLRIPALRLRVRCGWCADRPAIDGFGPIPAGVPVSDGLCKVCEARLHTEMAAKKVA